MKTQMLKRVALSLGALACFQVHAQTAPFQALRLAGPARSTIFTFDSHAGRIEEGSGVTNHDSDAGNFETSRKLNDLESYIKSFYLRDDLRVILAVQSLAQVLRSSDISADLKKTAKPVLDAWKKNTCQSLLNLKSAGLLTFPMGNLCDGIEGAQALTKPITPAVQFALNPLAMNEISIPVQDIQNLNDLLAQKDFAPLAALWRKSYNGLFSVYYWQVFDSALKEWTWKMILQEEAFRLKLHSPTDKELVTQFNNLVATTHTGNISVADAQIVTTPAAFNPTFLAKTRYLMAPFETDTEAFSYNFQTAKLGQTLEKMRSDFSQGVMFYLVRQKEGDVSILTKDLRELDTAVNTKSYTELNSDRNFNEYLKELIEPGNIYSREVQIAVDTTKNKPAIHSLLMAKLDDKFVQTLDADINQAVQASSTKQDDLENAISALYQKALETGLNANLQNKILLYELTLEIKKTGLKAANSGSSWLASFNQLIAKADLASPFKLEDQYRQIFDAIASDKDSPLANPSLRAVIEFRVLEIYDRMLLSEETRYAGIWKANEVSSDSMLSKPVAQLAQGLSDAQKGLSLVYLVKQGDVVASKIFGQDPFLEGLTQKIFGSQDWKQGITLKNLVAINYDINIKDGVHIFIVDKVEPSKIISAFDKQAEVGDIFASREYLQAFGRLREGLLGKYMAEITLKSGVKLENGSDELKLFLLSGN